MRYGGNITGACADLATSTTNATFGSNDAALVDFILSKANTHASLVAQTVCSAAVALKDSEMWIRAIKACSKPGQGLAVFKEPEMIQNAIVQLSFSKVQPG